MIVFNLIDACESCYSWRHVTLSANIRQPPLIEPMCLRLHPILFALAAPVGAVAVHPDSLGAVSQ